MDKGGGGLTLDPNTFRAIKRRQSLDPTGFDQFPINLPRREAAPPPSPQQEKRSSTAAAAGEMDFFSTEKKFRVAAALNFAVKKEDQHTVNTGLQLANTGSDQSMVDEDEKEAGKSELEAMQAELGKMTEENQKLKGMLAQVINSYNSLQTHFVALMQHRAPNTVDSTGGDAGDQSMKTEIIGSGLTAPPIVPRQFMDLGLATDADQEPSTNSSTGAGSHDTSSPSPANRERSGNSKEMIAFDGGGFRPREESPENSSHVWAPTSMQSKLGGSGSKAVEQAQEVTMRKARVSVRARSEAPMITDGCQWRKYGQKMAKGNPCPRAYYRCTMASGCPVRKQVQRCAEDRSILITTYEGNHNHPLPPAAMAMASTTSAAASMLLSGSMPSSDGLMNNNNILARTILPCSSSMATISASAPFPTVTLDLTRSPNTLHQYPRPPPQFQPPAAQPQPPQPSALPQIFGHALYNQSKFSGLHMPSGEPPHNLADTVSAATAAITADPNFTAALAAAITSIIGGGQQQGGGGGGSSSNNGGGNSSVGKLPAGWNFPTS